MMLHQLPGCRSLLGQRGREPADESQRVFLLAGGLVDFGLGAGGRAVGSIFGHELAGGRIALPHFLRSRR